MGIRIVIGYENHILKDIIKFSDEELQSINEDMQLKERKVSTKDIINFWINNDNDIMTLDNNLNENVNIGLKELNIDNIYEQNDKIIRINFRNIKHNRAWRVTRCVYHFDF